MIISKEISAHDSKEIAAQLEKTLPNLRNQCNFFFFPHMEKHGDFHLMCGGEERSHAHIKLHGGEERA